jgi:hypothetical protein
MVEMLTCIKDWEAAEARLQHMVEDKELEEAFEEFYLDYCLCDHLCNETVILWTFM